MVDNKFILGLQTNSLSLVREAEKGDCHNHVARGGNIKEYRKAFGIPTSVKPIHFSGYEEMEEWYRDSIRIYFKDVDYLKRIIFALRQLVNDGIKFAVITYGNAELELFKTKKEFVEIQTKLFKELAPNVKISPEYGINTSANLDKIEGEFDEILKLGFFRSIDIHGKEVVNPSIYKKIYSKAYRQGLKLRAHVGEFGEPEIIRKTLYELELEEINHGNHAALDRSVMKDLLNNRIRVNMCPHGNICLGLYNSLKEHPIKLFFEYGIKVTVNTDDMLIFDKSISDIFLDLYQNDIFSLNELDEIRRNSLE